MGPLLGWPVGGEVRGQSLAWRRQGWPPWYRGLSLLDSVILFPQFLCMFEENYPETLKHLFIIKGKLGTACDEAKQERGA